MALFFFHVGRAVQIDCMKPHAESAYGFSD
jgi:hypothetical protein